MNAERLAAYLERWARYECAPASTRGPMTMLAKLAEGKGQIMPASTAPGYSRDAIEIRISSMVAELAAFNSRAAQVLRVEYGVIRLPGVHPTDTQITRASALPDVPSLRTYRRLLKTARDFIEQKLEDKTTP
ncbi:MAG: hypothetical protein CMB99_16305 [Flavobacteriaceae bacterium]|nr:hypothetical protein [Flavobacteriaceae bacterium]|tara:strand:- start:5094 stop:5489 length:396 start_codon:yes stop_codon:yes gene_type:complete